jgi:hypothetical protein
MDKTMNKRQIIITDFDKNKKKYSVIDNEIEKMSTTVSILLSDVEAIELANEIYKNFDIGWISVKDKLPENKIVIVYTVHETMAMARCVQFSENNYQWNVFMQYGVIYLHGREFYQITHWMPLPDPPIESGN